MGATLLSHLYTHIETNGHRCDERAYICNSYFLIQMLLIFCYHIFFLYKASPINLTSTQSNYNKYINIQRLLVLLFLCGTEISVMRYTGPNFIIYQVQYFLI